MVVATHGCELCGDFPVQLHARCHPTAPLRVEMPSPGELVFYCYLPSCNREVTRLRVQSDRYENDHLATALLPILRASGWDLHGNLVCAVLDAADEYRKR